MARMDTRIALGIEPPDFIGAMNRGALAGQQRNDIDQTNALRNFMAQSGGDVFAGDQNALRQYAQFDPNAAYDMQAAQADAARRDQLFQMEQQRFGMDQQRFAAENAPDPDAYMSEIVSGLGYYFSQGDTEGYYSALESAGIAPEDMPIEAFPMVAAQFGVEAQAPEQRDPAQRYQAVGGNIWDYGDGSGPPVMLPGQGQETVVYGPDGLPVYSQGSPGTAQRFTEGQSRDNVYATRARGALEVLNGQNPDGTFAADELTSFGQRVAGWDPTGLIRGAVQSDNFQVMQQAGNEFLQAILRKDTGAAITADEQQLYGETYLPQPGDSEARLIAKRDARIRALAAIEAGMNPAQIVARDQALINAANESGTAQPATPPPVAMNANGPAPTGGITAQSVRTMTPMAFTEFMSTITAADLANLPTDVLEAITERPQ